MNARSATEPLIRIAVVGSDPLRLAGFRAVLGSEPDFEMISVPLSQIGTRENVSIAILGNDCDQISLSRIAKLKAVRPNLRIVVTGAKTNDETILKTIAAGAKGYVDEAAPPAEFARAVRVVHRGLIWAPRRVLSMFIEHMNDSSNQDLPRSGMGLTPREKEVLALLIAGRSNKEIAGPLGIEERTVKSHIGKLMHKVGVQNRIMLSVHAIKHSLVAAK